MHSARLFTLSTLSLATLHAFAAVSTEMPPSWLKAGFDIPARSRAPLVVTLSPDEAACRARYGRSAEEKCRPTFGRYGARITGISLTPAHPGTWRWEGSDTLAFTPDEPWPERTAYTVNLSGLRLPASTTLVNPTPAFATPPLTLVSGDMRFWMDPAVNGRRSLSVEADFSTVVRNTAAFESQMRIDFDPKSGLVLGRPTFVWNHEKTRVYVRIPIERLGRRAADVRVTMGAAVGRWEADRTNRPVVKPGFETASLHRIVPATDDLYRIRDASLTPTRTDTLERVYELTLRPSLLTKPADLMKVLRITALPPKLNVDAVSPTDWSRAPVITEETLRRGTPVAVTALQDVDMPTDRVTLRLSTAPGTFLHVSLPEGFGPQSDVGLAKAWSTVLPAHDPGAAVSFLQPGHMMTLSGSRTLTLLADGVDRVRWRIERIRDPFLALAAQDYRAHETVRPAETLADAAEGEVALTPGRRFASIALDEARLPGRRAGLFQVTLTGERRTKDGWQYATDAHKLVLVTDTGLIAKTSADGSHTVFSVNLVKGTTPAGLEVSLLGANGVPIDTVKTDAAGMARFATTRGLEREKAPAAVVAVDRATGDLAWLSMADAANIDAMTDLDTAGRHVSADGLTGLVFADRGIYRPGDTVHAGAVVKTADWHALPEGLPLTLRATDAAGRTLAERTPTLTPEGTLEADWTLPGDALTGPLRIDLTAGDTVLSTHRAWVGDFAPESMRLSASLVDRAAGWMRPEDLSVTASLVMNYGTSAADKLVRGRVALAPADRLRFAGYDGWTFVDPTPFEGRPDTRTLDEVHTDRAGRATLTLPLAGLTGTLQARVLLEGFETAGGRTATENIDFLVSPAERMLGWKTTGPEPDLHWLEAGADRSVDCLLIDRHLKPSADTDLVVTTALRQTVTELSTDSRGMLRYHDRTVEKPLSEQAVRTDADGRLSLPLDTASPGDYVLVVRASDGRVLARLPYHVAGADLRPALNGTLPNAGLRLETDRADYGAGETARLNLVSPFDGMALLTLESDRILTSKWVPVKRGANTAELPLPADVSGRAWLYASLVRSAAEAPRWLKAYARTARPVMLNLKARTLGITLDAPTHATDPRKLTVTVKTDAPSRVFLWAVDEGILSLTDYRTPSPVDAILKDRGLQVATRQTLDTLMPEGIRLPGEAPYGGDFMMKSEAMANAMANPFRRTAERAAVWWAGSIEADERGRTFEMVLPETFNGGVRLMAVGASAERIGHASTETVVRAPVMLTSLLPPFAAPGDRFDAFALLRADGPWTGAVTLSTPEGLAVDRSAHPVTLEAAGEARVRSELTVGDVPGAVRLTLSALGKDGTTLTRSIPFSVRPVHPRINELRWGPFGAPLSQSLTTSVQRLPFEELTSLTVSTTASPMVRGLMHGLSPSVWGTQSAIAAAHPWVAMTGARAEDLPNGSTQDFRRDAEHRIASALKRIESSLEWSGLAPWRGAEPDLMTSAWALDFLLTLRDKQWGVDPELIHRLVDALGNRLDGLSPASLAEARTAAWALAQMTREGTLEAERIESLRRQMDERGWSWREDVTALYLAAAYRMMRMTAEADRLDKGHIRIDISKDADSRRGTIGGLTSLAAARRLTPSPELTARLVKAVIDRNVSSLTTTEISMTATALASASSAAGPDRLKGVSVVCADRVGSQTPETLVRTETGITLTSPGCRRFAVTGTESLAGLYWQTQEAGWPATALPASDGIEITKHILDADGRPVDTVRPGDVVTVEIRARRTAGDPDVPVVVTDLLPAGFAPLSHDTLMEGIDITEAQAAEDRMVGIVRLNAGESILTYSLRAQTTGTFTVPPAAAADIRDNTLRGRGKPFTLKVSD